MKRIIEIEESLFNRVKEKLVALSDIPILCKAVDDSKPYNPSGDLISREALIKTVEKEEGILWDSHGEDDLCVRKKYIDNAPLVETRPKGEWVFKHNSSDIWCSVCDENFDEIPQAFNFCPNCGAKMKGGAE